jgi:hypothetical protein
MEKIGKTLGLTGVGLAVVVGLGYAAIVNANNITALRAMHSTSQTTDGQRTVSHRDFSTVNPITSGAKPFLRYWLHPMTRTYETPVMTTLYGLRGGRF